MAIYKGREVQVLGPSSGEDTSKMYDVLDQWSQRSSVKLSELRFTGKEIEDMKKAHVEQFVNYSKIEDKDLQELKDGQDKQKIEEKQSQVKPGPVEVSKVMVDPAEVQDKSTITPAMKTVKK